MSETTSRSPRRRRRSGAGQAACTRCGKPLLRGQQVFARVGDEMVQLKDGEESRGAYVYHQWCAAALGLLGDGEGHSEGEVETVSVIVGGDEAAFAETGVKPGDVLTAEQIEAVERGDPVAPRRIRGFPDVLPTKTDEGEVVPRVAVQSHLDGDPRPRPDEIANWDEVRRQNGLDEFLCQILLPDESVTDGPMPGYAAHWWRLFERDGEPVVEPTDVDLQIVPEGAALSDPGSHPSDHDKYGGQLEHAVHDRLEGDVEEARERAIEKLEAEGHEIDRDAIPGLNELTNVVFPGHRRDGRVVVRKTDDDPDGISRVSIGGTPEIGYYFVYRGDAGKALDAAREALAEAEKQLRPPVQLTTVDDDGKPSDWDGIVRTLEENESDRFMFRVSKMRPEPGRTFSSQGMEGLTRNVLAFVLSRVNAHWNRTGKPPRELTLYGDVTLDHEDQAA